MDTTADASPSSTRELTIAAIRRDLSAFAAAVRATPVQDGAAWHALARRWGYVTDSLDDSDAEMPSELGGLLNACSRGMCQLGQGAGSGDERAALAVRIVAVREHLARHGGPMPIAPGPLPWLLLGLPDDQRRRALRRAGTAPRWRWRMTHRAFERLDERAFRYQKS
jgi:hypothetical protein